MPSPARRAARRSSSVFKSSEVLLDARRSSIALLPSDQECGIKANWRYRSTRSYMSGAPLHANRDALQEVQSAGSDPGDAARTHSAGKLQG